jgi:hypothetical protein
MFKWVQAEDLEEVWRKIQQSGVETDFANEFQLEQPR